MKRHVFILISCLIAAGCANKNRASGFPAEPKVFSWVQSTKADSPMTGKASFWPSKDGTRIRVVVTGAPPGAHGMHVHEHGDCSDEGNAAGSHFNPDHVGHGDVVKDGMQKAHPGDLGNIVVDPTGMGSLEVFVANLTLDRGKYGIANRSIIIHEKADDFSQPTGNAGGRIACALIPAPAVEKSEEVKPAPAEQKVVPETPIKKKRNPWLLWLR